MSSSTLADGDQVPDDLRRKGLHYCRQLLGGSWTEVSSDKFHMHHIRGGLSNLLYCCRLSDDVPLTGDEPRSVLLRLYGQIIRENPETVLTDSVIFALLAEKKLGPQLFGVFTEGRVEEYVPSRHLNTQELRDPDISEACARIMAQFHRLRMPIVKEPKWLFDIMTRETDCRDPVRSPFSPGYLDEALNHVKFDSDKVKCAQLQKILSFNLAEELKCLREMVRKVHSPVVFCHNDLQEGNILYVETPSGWHVRPIDFEYASYNYRGFDIGNHFCEWCYNYESNKPPYFDSRLEDYPSREQQLRFIRAYLEASKSDDEVIGDGVKSYCNSHDGADTEEEMLLEVNTFALASHFMWGLWAIVQSHISVIQFGYLEYALERFTAYFKQKELVEQSLVGRMPNGIVTSPSSRIARLTETRSN